MGLSHFVPSATSLAPPSGLRSLLMCSSRYFSSFAFFSASVTSWSPRSRVSLLNSSTSDMVGRESAASSSVIILASSARCRSRVAFACFSSRFASISRRFFSGTYSVVASPSAASGSTFAEALSRRRELELLDELSLLPPALLELDELLLDEPAFASLPERSLSVRGRLSLWRSSLSDADSSLSALRFFDENSELRDELDITRGWMWKLLCVDSW